jgi:hypothetical protein
MLPREEMENMVVIMTEAVHMAAERKVDEGYDLLIAGLHRAEDIRAAGEPWAEDLLSHYRFTLDHYCERYTIPRLDLLVRA